MVSLISLSYSMPVFSANSFGLFSCVIRKKGHSKIVGLEFAPVKNSYFASYYKARHSANESEPPLYTSILVRVKLYPELGHIGIP